MPSARTTRGRRRDRVIDRRVVAHQHRARPLGRPDQEQGRDRRHPQPDDRDAAAEATRRRVTCAARHLLPARHHLPGGQGRALRHRFRPRPRRDPTSFRRSWRWPDARTLPWRWRVRGLEQGRSGHRAARRPEGDQVQPAAVAGPCVGRGALAAARADHGGPASGREVLHEPTDHARQARSGIVGSLEHLIVGERRGRQPRAGVGDQ
jgi:hypothetical protein